MSESVRKGRPPAPEKLVAITVRVPESRALWVRQNVKNRSRFFAEAIAAEMDAEIKKPDIGGSVGLTGKH